MLMSLVTHKFLSYKQFPACVPPTSTQPAFPFVSLGHREAALLGYQAD